MTPITQFKRWQREARKLPVPSEMGVWCVSPNGTRFVTVLEWKQNKWWLAWSPCSVDLQPCGMLFESVEIPL